MKKARLVAKGFQGDNIHATLYSPVVKLPTVKLPLSMTLQQENWHIRQLDVPTSFLNVVLESDVYIYIPEEVHEKIEILKLKLVLYGLREAPKCWNREDIPKIICYSDADWGGDRIYRKSCSGNAANHCGNLISWRSRKQLSVALSSLEAEYVDCNLAGAELLYLKELLSKLCPGKDKNI